MLKIIIMRPNWLEDEFLVAFGDNLTTEDLETLAESYSMFEPKAILWEELGPVGLYDVDMKPL